MTTLTAAEEHLRKSTDHELRKQAAVISFDADRMVARVNGDAWQSILQAHLYLDHIITLILSESLKNPKALKLERVSFSQKIDLIVASDLVSPDIIGIIRAINKVRNQIAHDVDFDVDEGVAESILRRVPKHLVSHIRAEPVGGEGFTLRKTLIITVILLDIIRQRLAGDRLVGAKAELELRLAVREIRARGATS